MSLNVTELMPEASKEHFYKIYTIGHRERNAKSFTSYLVARTCPRAYGEEIVL
jgi:hypothetical protein